MSHLIHCTYLVLAHVELFQLMLLFSRRKNKNITTKRVEKQCKHSLQSNVEAMATLVEHEGL
jgi:hypothetical protein